MDDRDPQNDCGGTAMKSDKPESWFKGVAKRAWKKLLGLKSAKAVAQPNEGNVYSTTTTTTAKATQAELSPSPLNTEAENTRPSTCAATASPTAPRRPSRVQPPRLSLSSEITDHGDLHPLTVESINLANRPGLLPQASSFYDDDGTIRTSIIEYTPGILERASPYSTCEMRGVLSSSTLDMNTGGFRSSFHSALPRFSPTLSDSWQASEMFSSDTSYTGPSFSRLQEATRPRAKTLRSSQLAAKVFGITELCETILLAAYPGIQPLIEPPLWLFTAKRVNKNFLNTIKGSPKLKQFMWLSRMDGMPGRDWSLWDQPLGWLLKSAGLLREVTCNNRRDGRHSFQADFTIRFAIQDFRVNTFLSRLKSAPRLERHCGQSSWRWMQTCKWLVAPTVRFEFQYISGTAYDTVVPARRYERMHWMLDDRKTLGDVYDVLRQVLQIYDDYRARANEIARIRADEDLEREHGLQVGLRRICGS